MSNHDASQVGVPYTRISRITIHYPDGDNTPSVVIEQSEAVKLLSGVVRHLGTLPTIVANLDFSKATDPVPLVNPNLIGSDTTLQQAFMCVLAIARQEQNKAEQV
jgi:hypothetical protein